MKAISGICCFFFVLGAWGQMDEIRELFAISSMDESANEKLLEKTKNAQLVENPVLFGYYGAGLMTMANHYTWPSTKLDYFNRGKKILEKAVNYDYQNVELRFIRYSVQRGAPLMLGYSDNIDSDKKFILKNIKKSGWTAAYQSKIITYLEKE